MFVAVLETLVTLAGSRPSSSSCSSFLRCCMLYMYVVCVCVCIHTYVCTVPGRSHAHAQRTHARTGWAQTCKDTRWMRALFRLSGLIQGSVGEFARPVSCAPPGPPSGASPTGWHQHRPAYPAAHPRRVPCRARCPVARCRAAAAPWGKFLKSHDIGFLKRPGSLTLENLYRRKTDLCRTRAGARGRGHCSDPLRRCRHCADHSHRRPPAHHCVLPVSLHFSDNGQCIVNHYYTTGEVLLTRCTYK